MGEDQSGKERKTRSIALHCPPIDNFKSGHHHKFYRQATNGTLHFLEERRSNFEREFYPVVRNAPLSWGYTMPRRQIMRIIVALLTALMLASFLAAQEDKSKRPMRAGFFGLGLAPMLY
jgi:hypothetical protein